MRQLRKALTRDQVQQARERALRGDTICQIARDLGAGEPSTRMAIRGMTFESVTEPAPVSQREQSAGYVTTHFPAVAEHYYAGKTYPQIVELTGLGYSKVRQMCLRLQAHKPRTGEHRSYVADRRAKALISAKVSAGHTPEQIAAQTKMDLAVVKDVCEEITSARKARTP